MEKTILLPTGDRLLWSSQAAVIRFAGPRKVLATSAGGGGLREDLTAVFNHSDCGTAGVCEPMQGNNLAEHQAVMARRLGLDPEHTAGLDTAVNLDNLVCVEENYEELSVTALISGGADVNASCAGDPTTLHERAGEICPVPRGTIHIILLINQNLADGPMAEAMMTATEAKTGILRDLMQGSCYSSRLATGTGTDGMMVICDPSKGEPLYNAGKHFKLGELIGKAVRRALPEALFRQTGFCAQSQHSVLQRLLRFGITEETIVKKCLPIVPDEEIALRKGLLRMEKDGFLVAAVSLYIHLADQMESGMLPAMEAADWGERILTSIYEHYHCDPLGESGLTVPEQMIPRMEQLLCDVLLLHIAEQNRLYHPEKK